MTLKADRGIGIISNQCKPLSFDIRFSIEIRRLLFGGKDTIYDAGRTASRISSTQCTTSKLIANDRKNWEYMILHKYTEEIYGRGAIDWIASTECVPSDDNLLSDPDSILENWAWHDKTLLGNEW